MKITEENTIYEICWFCGSQPSGSSSNKWVTMYDCVQRGIVDVNAQSINIKIPRCPKCRSVHKKKRLINLLRKLAAPIFIIGFWGLFVSIFVLLFPPPVIKGAPSMFRFLTPIFFQRGNDFYFFISIAVTGILAMWLLPKANRLLSKSYPNVKPISYIRKFPMIEEKLSEGWKFGERPVSSRERK